MKLMTPVSSRGSRIETRGKDYWDMNSLVSFAPPQHFEDLATADTSRVVDATTLV